MCRKSIGKSEHFAFDCINTNVCTKCGVKLFVKYYVKRKAPFLCLCSVDYGIGRINSVAGNSPKHKQISILQLIHSSHAI